LVSVDGVAIGNPQWKFPSRAQPKGRTPAGNRFFSVRQKNIFSRLVLFRALVYDAKKYFFLEIFSDCIAETKWRQIPKKFPVGRVRKNGQPEKVRPRSARGIFPLSVANGLKNIKRL